MSNEGTRTIRRTPTLQDVAAIAGVSPATVSRVINNVRNVDADLHRTVMLAVQETGYVPNRVARSLVTRRAGSMALVVSEADNRPLDDPFTGRFFSDPFFGRVVGGLLSVLQPAGVHLSLTLSGSAENRSQVVTSLRQGHLDGVAVLSLHPHDQLPGMLAAAGVPAVLYGRPMDPMSISYVDVVADDAARLAADHLVARGCRTIVTVSGSWDSPAGTDRLGSFCRAMAGHGRHDVPAADGSFKREGGAEAMATLLRDHPDLDGVFAASDVMAQGAMNVLRDAGRRIPEDVAVIGFDDSSAALSTWPQLTTIRQPVEDMAAEMGRLLLRRAEDPLEPARAELFEPTLVVRGSA